MSHMSHRISRRRFAAGFVAVSWVVGTSRRARAAEEPFRLRCSLDTAPSHLRNVSVSDYLKKLETASNGRISPQLFHSGQLFPDLQVGKALLEGQIEMAVPGHWTMTGLISDADFFQLPVLEQLAEAYVEHPEDY